MPNFSPEQIKFMVLELEVPSNDPRIEAYYSLLGSARKLIARLWASNLPEWAEGLEQKLEAMGDGQADAQNADLFFVLEARCTALKGILDMGRRWLPEMEEETDGKVKLVEPDKDSQEVEVHPIESHHEPDDEPDPVTDLRVAMRSRSVQRWGSLKQRLDRFAETVARHEAHLQQMRLASVPGFARSIEVAKKDLSALRARAEDVRREAELRGEREGISKIAEVDADVQKLEELIHRSQRAMGTYAKFMALCDEEATRRPQLRWDAAAQRFLGEARAQAAECDFSAARQALDSAVELSEAAARRKQERDDFLIEISLVAPRVEACLKNPMLAGGASNSTLTKRLDEAERQGERGDFAGGLELLGQLARDCQTIQRFAVAHDAPAQGNHALAALKDQAKTLTQALACPPGSGLKAAVKTLHDSIDFADSRSREKPLDIVAFVQQTRKIEALLQLIPLMADRAPREAFKKPFIVLCHACDGDAMNKTVGWMPRPDVAFLAIELRYGLVDGGASDEAPWDRQARVEEVRHLYDVLGAVPEGHVRGNERLLQVRRRPHEKRATYYARHAEISIPAFDGFGLQDPMRPPEAGQDCRLREDIVTLNYDWTVLHEIGHAVDTKMNFMRRNQASIEFGGWRIHDSAEGEILKAVATALGVDEAFAPAMVDYLRNGNQPQVWPSGWPMFVVWANTASHGANPWRDHQKCAKPVAEGGFRLGDRVVYQCDPDRWVSYDFNARKMGISAYQFRAPGEWFAELYAAYASNMLNAAHPARRWMKAEVFAPPASA